LQPLVSVWNREMLPFIERALNQGTYSLKPLFQKHKVTYVPHTALTDAPATFLNVNTKEEDEEMREWLKSEINVEGRFVICEFLLRINAIFVVPTVCRKKYLAMTMSFYL